MARMRLNFFSEVLGRQTYVNILLPQATTGEGRGWSAFQTRPPFPTLYLLHGLSDDQEAWMRNTSIERYVEKRNLAVVMPTTDRGFYTDTTYGTNYFAYVGEELPRVLRQYLPLSEKREDTYAAGLSMGGYGALKLALRHPKRFSFAASLSGAMICAQVLNESDSDIAKELRTIFGPAIKPEDDVFLLLKKAAPKPRLFICCGEKDTWFAINDAARKHADKLGYDLTWQVGKGYDHEWAYWDLMIQTVLETLPEQTR